MSRHRTGLIFGFTAYVAWGLFPLYWPLLNPAGAFEIVAHRAIWSLVFCLIALAVTKQLKGTFALLKDSRIMRRLLLATVLISINWLVYIWAVNHHHVVDASLGYYMNPLVSIGFGVISLKERMRRLQWFSVAVATIGVIILTVDAGTFPWVALSLAFSFGSYGFVKKKLNLGALQGLTMETLILFIPFTSYLLWLSHKGEGSFGVNGKVTFFMILGGAVTAIPLLLFNGSTTRIPLSMLGLIQFLTPTIQFLIGVFVRHESMPAARWVGFFVIWIALCALAYDLYKPQEIKQSE